MRFIYVLPIYIWLSGVFASSSSAEVQDACPEIKDAVPGKLFYPQDTPYSLENTDYYNIGLAELKPACIFQQRQLRKSQQQLKS